MPFRYTGNAVTPDREGNCGSAALCLCSPSTVPGVGGGSWEGWVVMNGYEHILSVQGSPRASTLSCIDLISMYNSYKCCMGLLGDMSHADLCTHHGCPGESLCLFMRVWQGPVSGRSQP